jgi:hypothetical protein
MRNLRSLLLACCLLTANQGSAEQKVTVDGYEVHYIVIPTTFLNPNIASQYGLVRGQDRALVNVSVLNAEGSAVSAQVSGTAQNLIGQIDTLEFTEVSEGDAIYYLAQLRHGNEEHRGFVLDVVLPDANTARIEFQQKMYWQH